MWNWEPPHLESAALLGAGKPLFEGVGWHRLRQVAVETSPAAIHLTYNVLPRLG